MRAVCEQVRISAASALLACVAFGAQSEAGRTSTVGMPAKIEELVLPAPELEVVPLDSRMPIVLRITATRAHGTDFRYDFEWCGLEAGKFDLATYLRAKDGTATKLAPIEVEVTNVLEAGVLKPNAPPERELPNFGGYRMFAIALGVVWIVGLGVFLFVGRKRRVALAERRRPRSLAERLRPLVERASRNQLSRTERSQLELGLVAYWRRKLALEDRRPDEALAILHEHADAGPLLKSLEQWLHVPTPQKDVDVSALLEPYRDLPADAIDVPS